MRLHDIAQWTGAQVFGADALINSVSIDTRSMAADALFIAIDGENRDGHAFVQQAADKGAGAAMVQQDRVASLAAINLPLLSVSDPTLALGDMARAWRSGFNLPVFGITGSNGKTTVTALVAAICRQFGETLSPTGSFNNHWGVPLTLLQLTEQHQTAVIEMGMNHPGEIAYLTDIARPDYALVNNVASAHLAGMGNLDNVAKAKAEIFQGLSEQGCAVLNADDAYFKFMRQAAGKRHVITFGHGAENDVTVSDIEQMLDGCDFHMRLQDQGQFAVSLPLLGAHNVANAMAAAALCLAAGIDAEHIVNGLSQAQAVSGRLTMRRGRAGSVVLDDSYNANPSSMQAAIDVLSSYSGRRIAVLGAMAELGDDSAQLHNKLGQQVKQQGIDELVVTAAAQPIADGFGGDARVLEDHQSIVDYLLTTLDKDCVVLLKGSRSAAMEKVLPELLEVKTC